MTAAAEFFGSFERGGCMFGKIAQDSQGMVLGGGPLLCTLLGSVCRDDVDNRVPQFRRGKNCARTNSACQS